LFFLASSAHCGETIKDSLWTDYTNSSLPDTHRLNSFKEMIYKEYNYGQPDTALILCDFLDSIAESKELPKYRGHAYNLKGISLNVLGRLTEALSSYELALKFYEEIGDLGLQAAVMNNMANVYGDHGNHVKSLDYYEKALQISEEQGDSAGMAVTLLNIGITYFNQDDIEQTIKFFNQGRWIAERSGQDFLKGPILNNLASFYFTLGDYDSARYFNDQSLALRRSNND
jgi:tetratricopeptide (TPR) repeat protein